MPRHPDTAALQPRFRARSRTSVPSECGLVKVAVPAKSPQLRSGGSTAPVASRRPCDTQGAEQVSAAQPEQVQGRGVASDRLITANHTSDQPGILENCLVKFATLNYAQAGCPRRRGQRRAAAGAAGTLALPGSGFGAHAPQQAGIAAHTA
eukprot:SAG31_NODE_602_length_13638_cov_32.936037_8_plen_151_part_00